MTTAIAFALAAAAGAVLRAQISRLGWRGTLVSNLGGSLALGWVLASGPTEGVATVVGVGFCGSLTTMSTFALDATDETLRHAAIVVVTTIVGGLLAVSVGPALT